MEENYLQNTEAKHSLPASGGFSVTSNVLAQPLDFSQFLNTHFKTTAVEESEFEPPTGAGKKLEIDTKIAYINKIIQILMRRISCTLSTSTHVTYHFFYFSFRGETFLFKLLLFSEGSAPSVNELVSAALSYAVCFTESCWTGGLKFTAHVLTQIQSSCFFHWVRHCESPAVKRIAFPFHTD